MQYFSAGEGGLSKISIKDGACVHLLSLLMMMLINIYTRGTDNRDVELESCIGGYGRCQPSVLKKAFSPG